MQPPVLDHYRTFIRPCRPGISSAPLLKEKCNISNKTTRAREIETGFPSMMPLMQINHGRPTRATLGTHMMLAPRTLNHSIQLRLLDISLWLVHQLALLTLQCLLYGHGLIDSAREIMPEAATAANYEHLRQRLVKLFLCSSKGERAQSAHAITHFASSIALGEGCFRAAAVVRSGAMAP